LGEAEEQVCHNKDRSADEETHCSEADESGSAEEVIGARESAVGCEKAGGR
jgi:hypothetical protein